MTVRNIIDSATSIIMKMFMLLNVTTAMYYLRFTDNYYYEQ